MTFQNLGMIPSSSSASTPSPTSDELARFKAAIEAITTTESDPKRIAEAIDARFEAAIEAISTAESDPERVGEAIDALYLSYAENAFRRLEAAFAQADDRASGVKQLPTWVIAFIAFVCGCLATAPWHLLGH